MPHWRLSVTGGATLDLPDSFSLQSYNRQTEFTETVLQGQDGVIIDAESRRTSAIDMVISGIIQKDNPTDADTELTAIENIADSREDNLNLVNINSDVSYAVQHISTVANRDPAGILNVILTFRGNVTIQ